MTLYWSIRFSAKPSSYQLIANTIYQGRVIIARNSLRVFRLDRHHLLNIQSSYIHPGAHAVIGRYLFLDFFNVFFLTLLQVQELTD